MKNKWFHIFLLLAVIIFAVSPFSVFAFVRSGEGEAVLLQEGAFDVPVSGEAK